MRNPILRRRNTNTVRAGKPERRRIRSSFSNHVMLSNFWFGSFMELPLVEGQFSVGEHCFRAGCAGFKLVSAVIDDGFNLKFVLRATAFQGGEVGSFDEVTPLLAAVY